jgi:hypothetical protein
MNPTPWNPGARQALDNWCAARRAAWLAAGADPDEVRSDLEDDLARRFAGRTGELAAGDISAALAAMDGAPAGSDNESGSIRPAFLRARPPADDAGKPKAGWLRRLGRWLTTSFWTTALWPALVLAAEALFGICRAGFFDPLPGWPHWLVVAAACAAAWVLARRRGGREAPMSPALAAWRGFALAVAAWWSLLLLPLLAIGTFIYCMGVAYSFGLLLALLPLFAGCALLAGAPMLLAAGLLRNKGAATGRMAGRLGLAAGVLAVLLVEGPGWVARIGVATGEPALVRALGSRQVLLRMCYEGSGGRGSGLDTSGWLASVLQGKIGLGWAAGSETDKARLMFYRVTGRPFNAEKPPAGFAGSGRGGDLFDEFEFDPDLGGDGVFARVRHLDLAASRLDGHVDAASGLGYWEWTLVFRNDSPRGPAEARMQVLLPPDGVVSRLTLWVEGEPREAAFSSTAKVTEAYKSIAVVQRRDPVLARWVAPDRVLVQCFPVPQNGEMKIRLGITAPLEAGGRLPFPRLIEQNFGLARGLATDLWVQGDAKLAVAGLTNGSSAGDWREVHGSLPFVVQASRGGGVSVERPAPPPLVWTTDPFADPTTPVLVRESLPAPSPAPPGECHLVIDGSASLAPWKIAIAKALDDLAKAGAKPRVTLATDAGALTGGPEILAGHRFAGGIDNSPALRAALDAAASTGASRVVWLHGAQPVEFPATGGLVQWFDRALRPVELVSIDLVGGPNRILEALGHRSRVRGGGRPAGEAELAAILDRAVRDPGVPERWSRLPAGAQPPGAVAVWDQLARWAAWRELAAAASPAATASAAETAARCQLVTPWSGAVVLETRQQFEQFGLEPVDPAAAPSIPSVPEPSAAVLVLLSSLLFLRRRR